MDMKSFKQFNEDIKIPIKVGDIVLGGKFKNKKIKVKSIGKNEKGDITINNRPLLKFRIITEKLQISASEYRAGNAIDFYYFDLKNHKPSQKYINLLPISKSDDSFLRYKFPTKFAKEIKKEEFIELLDWADTHVKHKNAKFFKEKILNEWYYWVQTTPNRAFLYLTYNT